MRGKQAPKRKILPDPRYQSTMVAKFQLRHAREEKPAQSIVYDAFDLSKNVSISIRLMFLIPR